ncbi:DUF2279 domain-containing protein [Marinigracilibium pacificum]|uniref:DUF2279 domain-containing protein n=1 Tax=Marinigracilibium pacificum TaxID=2729599 RepID=A0A848IV10_9BACT|nr:DUF2279 domain-containing protein [Marinigracilibium pacificum]NMM47125.1 DUF2279 domain-containing protein [Marinigracilibium pacificum]
MKRQFLFILFFSITSLCFGQHQLSESYPDSIDKKKLIKTIGIETGTYLAGISFLQFIWYKDHDRVPFHYYDDSKGYLQMDKAGHAFGAYRYSYSAYYALRAAGVSKKKALIYGGPTGLIFQTPIEIFDGMYEGWGFSWYDMIANTAGSAIFTIQEAVFDEQIFLMKFSYSPSIYPDYHDHLGENHIQRFFLDYNAHTYWLSGNIKKLTGIQKVPDWLNISFGYSANGMIYEFDNPTYYQGEPFPHFERYRQYLISLDVDFSRIRTNKKWVRGMLKALNLIKIPFPAVEFNRVDGVKFNPVYF